MPIPAIILAAGASTRIGRPKPLLPVAPDGETFLGRLVRTFQLAGVRDIVVVVGAYAGEVGEAIARLPVLVRLVENEQYERGQLSSLLAALDIVDRPGVEAVLVMPVDMPLVTSETVHVVVRSYLNTRRLVVRPVVETRHGHPVLFDRALFGDLRHADAARGARAVIEAHASDVLDVPVADLGAVEDIDTREDYERYTGLRLD